MKNRNASGDVNKSDQQDFMLADKITTRRGSTFMDEQLPDRSPQSDELDGDNMYPKTISPQFSMARPANNINLLYTAPEAATKR